MTFEFATKAGFTNSISAKIIATPIGEMLACANDEGVVLLEFADKKNLQSVLNEISKSLKANITFQKHKILDDLQLELEQYFNHNLQVFTVPINPVGTEFQKKVWQVLRKIPYGETRSYAAQAKSLGSPKSVRAVANANGRNKISIIIPCHRVIGSNGTLTGYSGGIDRKMRLLELENAIIF